jgi:phosphatidylinositol glycan class Q protein
LEIAFYGFASLGPLGASMLVAFAIDAIQVATLHLHMCYVIVTTVVYGLRLFTSTLWNLFQGMIFVVLEYVTYLSTGKCYNQLCNRNDKWVYEMDHLVLGTIFFTLATFLMPTVLIYQVFFSVIDNLLHLPLSTFDSNCKSL